MSPVVEGGGMIKVRWGKPNA